MAREPALILSDDDFLALVREEADQSIGLDSDDELASNRETALNYLKGEMDIPSLPNRSTAVDTTFAEAVDTVMPDLMEILTGGDDVATFRPHGQEDEEAAAQETDYVNHVIFNENAGWRVLHDHIFDGLTAKIGVTKVWGEEDEEVSEEQFEGKTPLEAQLAEQGGGEVIDLIATEPDPITGEPLFNFTLRTVKPVGRGRLMAVAPEDFAFARDTTVIAETTYCSMRSRPRAQDLIADDYDPELVAELTPYGLLDDGVQQARDQGGEHDDAHASATSEHNLHQVEIREHYIRVDADGDGQPELWCVVTNADATLLLKREKASRVPFAVSTPFLMAHRLIGMSLYDKLREVQRIKTVLMRAMLDSAYFALNQRYEVAEGAGKANANTLNDLLNNVPGAPVRSVDGNAVRPLGGSALSFDVFGGLEFMSTVAEQRSGIVRNAQGLNPDTLHETKGGMQALMGAAQKRVRMIARVLAETGIKDIYLLMHDVVRTTAKASSVARLRGKWVEVDPSKWGARNDMTIEVGIGSGGREMELAALNMVAGAQERLVSLQGGADGPFVTAQNLYATAKKLAEKAGLKSADPYFTDPATAPPQQPKPDPDMEKAKLDADVTRYKVDQEMELKRYQIDREMELKREEIGLNAQVKAITGLGAGRGRVELGGDPG